MLYSVSFFLRTFIVFWPNLIVVNSHLSWMLIDGKKTQTVTAVPLRHYRTLMFVFLWLGFNKNLGSRFECCTCLNSLFSFRSVLWCFFVLFLLLFIVGVVCVLLKQRLKFEWIDTVWMFVCLYRVGVYINVARRRCERVFGDVYHMWMREQFSSVWTSHWTLSADVRHSETLPTHPNLSITFISAHIRTRIHSDDVKMGTLCPLTLTIGSIDSTYSTLGCNTPAFPTESKHKCEMFSSLNQHI